MFSKNCFFFHRKTKYKNKNIKIYVIIFIMDNYKYTCLACDFKCQKRGDYNRHIKTKKHLKMISNDKKKYICEICDKVYLNRSGLWRHKKTCEPKESNFKELYLKLLKEHKKLKLEIETKYNYLIEKQTENENLLKEVINLMGTTTITQV